MRGLQWSQSDGTGQTMRMRGAWAGMADWVSLGKLPPLKGVRSIWTEQRWRAVRFLAPHHCKHLQGAKGWRCRQNWERKGKNWWGEPARNERTGWRHRAGRMISTRWQVSIIYHLYTIKKYNLTMGRAWNKLNSNSKAYGNKMQQIKGL